MKTDAVGVCGEYHPRRAICAQIALGANSPTDATNPTALGDAEGARLDGSKSGYALHFAKDALFLPSTPSGRSRSMTMRGHGAGWQVSNDLNRAALSSLMDMDRNPDGSLDFSFRPDSPDEGKAANWLPAPSGAFKLTPKRVNGASAPPARPGRSEREAGAAPSPAGPSPNLDPNPAPRGRGAGASRPLDPYARRRDELVRTFPPRRRPIRCP